MLSSRCCRLDEYGFNLFPVTKKRPGKPRPRKGKSQILPEQVGTARVNVSPWAAGKCMGKLREPENCYAQVNGCQRERESRRRILF